MLSLFAFVACAPDDDDDEPADEGPIGSYEMGWPIDACSTDFPEEGTGNGEGDRLKQYALRAQTGELVKLHDFCDHVVYLEFGYFT